jgi:hypothetical protein
MKTHALRSFLFSLLLISCADHKFDTSSTEESLTMAGALCQKTRVEMVWFQSLLTRIETDELLRGDIFAFSVDGRIIISHQPLIMSCYGCVLYDCDGNKIDMATVNHEKVVAGMKAENRIYSAF